MKNLKLTIALLGLSLPGPGVAATVCGRLTSEFVIHDQTGSEGYMCLNGTYSSSYDMVSLRYRDFDFACLSYTSDHQTASDKELGHHYLENCRVSSYQCGKYKYYTSNGCVACPTGSAADEYDIHQMSDCHYCTSEYYYSESAGGCVHCPLEGVTNLAELSYEPPVTQCLLLPGEYVDSTGSYEILAPRPMPDPADIDWCYYVL